MKRQCNYCVIDVYQFSIYGLNIFISKIRKIYPYYRSVITIQTTDLERKRDIQKESKK